MKCELCCPRPDMFVDEVTEIEFDGNKFKVCDSCKTYLEGEPYPVLI